MPVRTPRLAAISSLDRPCHLAADPPLVVADPADPVEGEALRGGLTVQRQLAVDQPLDRLTVALDLRAQRRQRVG